MQVYARQLRAQDRALGLVGSQANDISGKDQQGKSTSLLDIKAPYVALYFYNPECRHCIEKTPHLVKFYEQNKQNGFEVFALAMGTEDEIWNEFIEQNNMTWTNAKASDETKAYAKYYFRGTPSLFLLKPERKIIGKDLNLNDLVPIIQRDIQQKQLTLASE